MSTRYGIVLYFPIEQLKTAIAEFNDLADPRCTENHRIQLRNGITLRIFRSRSNHPPKKPAEPGKEANFITTLLFHVDELIEEYINQINLQIQSEQLVMIKDKPYFPIGNLSVGISLGIKYVRLSIHTVSSSQNLMIRHSTSVHNTMLKILQKANGIVGLIDVGDYDNLLLSDSSHVVRVDLDDEERFEVEDDIDQIVIEIQKQLTV